MPWQQTAAKILGIKLDNEPAVTRGESVSSTDTYVEQEPTFGEWIHEHTPTGAEVRHFFISLLPFLQWIGNYNLTWLTGDLIAGITIGFVVVPQSMAYAALALLPPEYGLYSSFVGVMLYWFFATSKDITIGPVAVMSTLTGTIVTKAIARNPEYTAPQIASALALICGAIVFTLGFLRLGFIVDFIPLPAIAAFMTGSALNIGMGQIPGLFGISSKIINNRAATYHVFINFWHHIDKSQLDAAIGLTALFLLYFVRWFANFMGKRQPNARRAWFFVATLRTAFIILLYTLISWLVNRHHRKVPKFKILGTVPKGFKHMGVPVINKTIIKSFASELPVAVIVLLIEHIAISKSFGRVNGYQINPSQELMAIGFTNLFGPFFGAYPATGSFSRTAIKAKAGVRTPIAGVITGVLVLLAIYLLTAVFYYIPSAALSAVIIHAVGDLITPPNVVYRFWRVSPVEVVIFFAGVLVSVFSSIENGIYTTTLASLVLFLFRVAKAHGHFLGRVKIHPLPGDKINDNGYNGGELKKLESEVSSRGDDVTYRDVFLPLDHRDGSNPEISVEHPFPGVFVYRFSEGYLYPNATHYTDQLFDYIQAKTKRTSSSTYARLGDRPWNFKGPRNIDASDIAEDPRPTFKAIILDFSSVNHVDITSIQALIDARNAFDRYAAPNHVDWYFAGVTNRWTKRALTSAGFGYPSADYETNAEGGKGPWRPIYSVSDIGQQMAGGAPIGDSESQDSIQKGREADAEANRNNHFARKTVLVTSINKPLFHVDVNAALIAAQENL